MIYLTAYAREGHQNRRHQEHILGRTLLNMGLQREYALFLSQLTVKTGMYGKPYLEGHPEIQFNISHCDGLAACVVHNRDVGLDVEAIRPFSGRLVKKMLTKEELAWLNGRELTPELFFRYWTLKESYLKARGTGLAASMKEISCFWTADGAVESSSDDYDFYQTCLWGTHLLALCIKRGPDGDEEEKERKSMTYQEIFEKAKGIFMKAEVRGIGEKLAFQFHITGEGEGIFYAEVKDGVLSVEPYEYYDRDAEFTCTAEVLFKIAEGRLDPVMAFTLGKLKVDGSIEKALKIKDLIQP